MKLQAPWGQELSLIHAYIPYGTKCLVVVFFLVAKFCPTLCDPMDCNTPGFPVLHHLLDLMMLSNHLILCCSLLLLLSIFPSIRNFPNELAFHIEWPKYWSFSISSSNEYSGMISFRIEWFDLLAAQGTLKSLLQQHSSKALVFWFPTFFMVQLSYPYVTSGKTITLTLWTFAARWCLCFLIWCLGWS